jgi:hypothetical protein
LAAFNDETMAKDVIVGEDARVEFKDDFSFAMSLERDLLEGL